MIYKFGRLPVRHTAYTDASLDVMRQHLAALGPPPKATNNWAAAVREHWGFMGNDTLGDCVCADVSHIVMLNTANASSIVVPTYWQNVKLYEYVGGYVPGDPSTDNGCNMTTMDEFLKANGFLGYKVDAYAMIDFTNLSDLLWSVQLFGSCSIGFNFPAWAMDAFNAGEPWGAPPAGADTSIIGGHDVPIVQGTSAGNFQCVTWGRLQPVSMAFWELYAEEAHARLDFDWIKEVGLSPSGFSLAQLDADLSEI